MMIKNQEIMTINNPFVAKPFFLVGAERSGTTLLRLMLDRHPQIAWCSESEYMVDCISDAGNFPNLAEYYEWLETQRIFMKNGFEIDRSLTFPQLLNDFLRQRLERTGKPIIGATVHRHFDRLLKIWPDAYFIHIIRDGRDVASSCIGMGWAGNVWTGIDRWIDAESLWERLKEDVPAQRRIEVQYERLIRDPAKELTAVCDFIGIPYDPLMLTYPQTTTYSFPDPKLIEQWRYKLSREEIRLIESRISDMLVKRGYELSGLSPLQVTASRRWQLRLQDWWARWVFRIKRYGLALFLLDYLSRRLRLRQWQKRIKLQLNAIDTAYLK
jgi:hypothetical protein